MGYQNPCRVGEPRGGERRDVTDWLFVTNLIKWANTLSIMEAKFLIVGEVKNMEKGNILELKVLVRTHDCLLNIDK